MSDRYIGKPFLRLLDSYVLDAIGALDETALAGLASLEPGLRRTYGTTGSWQEIVAAQMQFPEGMPGAIRETWEKGRPRFVEAHGREPDPNEFTRIFVDSNFPRRA
jgi:hypothetical protein